MTIQKLKTAPATALIVCWAMGGICLGVVERAEAAGAESAGIFDEQADAQSTTDGQDISVGSFGQVDLHVKDLEVAQVLQLLSLQSQRNIIASRNVAGSISADLYGVDFYEALDAILHTNGFGYQEKGNLIFVYTTAELDAIKAAERKVVHRVVRLNYITAADASAFVTPLLSGAGALSVSSDVAAGFQPSIADGGANSFAHSDTLIVHDYAENVDEIVAVLKELDKRPKQVLVEATILQAGLIEKNAFGVDLSVLADFAVNKFLDPLGVIDDVISGATPISTPGHQGRGGFSTSVGNTSTGLSGVKIGIVTHSVSAFIRALDDVTDTTVIANPKILVLNRQKSDLLVGRKLGYLSSTATDTSTTQTVEFLEIGTQLTLRPFVSDDGFIRMELRPSVSDGNTNRTVGTFVIPETRNQEMTTNVVVRNGQTVVMGGLFKEDTTVSRKQVPGLGDIPILGSLFKGHDDDVTRDEVIFLITPTIVKDEALYRMGDRVAANAEIARMGAREGLLPWSHSKMLSAHLKDAQKFYEQGDSRKAVWSADLALALDPKSVEAARMKEKVTGRRAYSPGNFSILQNAVDEMIQEGIGLGHGRSGQLPTDNGLPEQPNSSLEIPPAAPKAQIDTGGGVGSPPDSQRREAAAGRRKAAVDGDAATDQSDHDAQNQEAGGVGEKTDGAWDWAKNILDTDQRTDQSPQPVPGPQATTDMDPGENPAASVSADDPAGGGENRPVDLEFEDADPFTDWVESGPDADELWPEDFDEPSANDPSSDGEAGGVQAGDFADPVGSVPDADELWPEDFDEPSANDPSSDGEVGGVQAGDFADPVGSVPDAAVLWPEDFDEPSANDPSSDGEVGGVQAGDFADPVESVPDAAVLWPEDFDEPSANDPSSDGEAGGVQAGDFADPVGSVPDAAVLWPEDFDEPSANDPSSDGEVGGVQAGDFADPVESVPDAAVLWPEDFDEPSANDPSSDGEVGGVQAGDFADPVGSVPDAAVLWPEDFDEPSANDPSSGGEVGDVDVDQYTGWVELEPNVQELWSEEFEEKPANETHDAVVTDGMEADWESDITVWGVDEQVTPTQVIDQDQRGAAQEFGRVEQDIDPGERILPAMDDQAGFLEEMDLDLADLEWDQDPSVKVVVDEPTGHRDDPDEPADAVEQPTESAGSDVGKPARLRFMNDRVGSTDPFNAVVEWKKTPRPDGGE